MITYSQNNEEKILKNYFKEKLNGLVVEVGAASPEQISNSRFLIKNYNWDALLIEPNPVFYKQLKEFYKNEEKVICLECLVNDVPGVHKFYYLNDGYGSTMHELFRDKVGGNFIETFIEAKTLDSIISENLKNKKIDFLSIDAEGNDPNILKSINFNINDVELICLEATSSVEEYQSILGEKYKFYDSTAGNLFFNKIYE
jgi:hypothetical protein